MTNPQILQFGAPRSSCRHVCGFKANGVYPESGAFYTTDRERTEPEYCCVRQRLLQHPGFQARMPSIDSSLAAFIPTDCRPALLESGLSRLFAPCTAP